MNRNWYNSKHLYQHGFSNRLGPSDKMFSKLAKNLCENGGFQKKRIVFKFRTSTNQAHCDSSSK